MAKTKNSLNLEYLLSDYQKEWIEHPQFEKIKHRPHNWRRYVPTVFEQVWTSLEIETRVVIIIMAEEQADNEEWD